MSAERANGRRRLFANVPGEHRPHPVRNGAIVLTIVGLVLISGYGGRIPFLPAGGHTVKAVFSNVNDLTAHAPVRVDGVEVGEVTGVQLNPSGPGALVTMRLTHGGLTMHRDARAAVWWRTLLGNNFYVQLDPGSPTAPPLGDSVIPLSRTTSQQELDQVLQPLDGQGRHAIRTFIREFDRGVREDQAIPKTVDELAPALRPIGPALEALRGSDRGDLPALVANASTVLGALSRDEADLGGLIDNASTSLGVTAARQADIGSTLDQAPNTEQDTIATMGRLRVTLDRLDPLASALRPGARRLAPAASTAQPALTRLRTLLSDARPLLGALQPALRRLAGAAGGGVPLIAALTPTVTRARDDLVPWLEQVDPDSKLHNYAAIGPFVSALDSAAEGFDANGHALNFATIADEHSLVDAPCQTYLTDPSAAQKIDCTALMNVLAKALGGAAAPGGGG